MSGRYALLIATYQYEDDGLRRLISPAQDAEALARVLGDSDRGGFETKLLVNQNSGVVRQEIEAFFADRKRDDILLLYFSGHGLRDDYGRLYFATSETTLSHLRSTALSANFVNESMSDSRSRQQVLFLDCCYSGAFAKGMLVKADKSVGTKEQFEGKGRVILTASNSLQYAFEGDNLEGEGELSIFTQALVGGLETGQADLDQDGQITLDELYDYVHDRVTDETPKQVPGKWAFDVQGEIVIAKNPNPVVKPVELPVELEQSISNPLTWVREGAAQELGRMLKSGDKGLELSAYTALEGMMKDDSLRVRNLVSSILAGYTGLQQASEVGIEAGRTLPEDAVPKVKREAEEEHRPIKGIFLKIPKWIWIIAGLVGIFLVIWFVSQYGNYTIALRVTDTPTTTSAHVIVPSASLEPGLVKPSTPKPSPSVATGSPTILPSAVGFAGSFLAPEGTQPSGLAWDGNYLWMSSYMRNPGIYKLDPTNGSVMSVCTPPTASRGGYGGLAFDGKYLWQAGYDHGIYKLSTSDCSVISTIPGPENNISDLAWDGQYIWTCGYPSQRIYKLEPTSGEVLAEFDVPQGIGQAQTAGLTYVGSSLWLSGNDNEILYEINPLDGQVVSSKQITISRPGSLAWDGNRFWIASFDNAMIYPVDYP